MTIFGKSPTALEVMAADFLPDGNSLYIVAADASRNLHIFQYDPERKYHRPWALFLADYDV